MFSACYARLATNISGNRLQLLTSYQINKDTCYELGNRLKKDKKLLVNIPTVEPILKRLTLEPQFMVGMVQHNSIITGVIKLTSSLEFFLNDLVSLCMVRNNSLLKKGLKDIQINPFDIVEMDDLNKIREKYIGIITQDKCKGELWSKKLKRVCSFLEVSDKYYADSLNKAVDSIWMMRNTIAHGNSNRLVFVKDDVMYEHLEVSKEDEYIRFIEPFISIMDKLENLMEKLDLEALNKWSAQDSQ